MIHLVTPANRHLYPAALRAMHAERKRQFVDIRGWRLEVRDGGEYDDYDDDAAIYLIGFGTDGALAVSARLRPTLDGGIIGDVFPQLLDCSEPSLNVAGTYECTRYFTAERLRGVRGFEARSKLHIALIEAMHDLGGQRLVGLTDMDLLTHLRRFSGLKLRPVGLPCPYDEGGVTIAFEIATTSDALQHARTMLRIGDRQLFVAPEWLPSGIDVVALERATRVLLAAGAQVREALQDHLSLSAAAIIYQPDVGALMQDLEAAAA